MHQTAKPFALRQWVTETIPNVFNTMLSLKAVPAAEDAPPPSGERVSGSVGLGGERVTGAVYLHFSEPFARQVATSMLGMSPEEIGSDAEINDVVGELCNMVAGGLKSTLCDLGAPCAVSTPAIIRGSAFAIETPPDVPREVFVFDCHAHRLAVEVHLKLR
jgi:chemotaxis protein CheX